MNLLLKRIYTCSTYTIGKLYIEDKYVCDTLEDSDRGLLLSMTLEEIKKLKIYGKTAIPKGIYNIIIGNVGKKFATKSYAKPYNGKYPIILNVKGYSGILIHPGNTALDSLGCILVGYNKIKGQVVETITCYHKLMNLIKDLKDITITIE